MHQVVDDFTKRQTILQQLQDKSSHKWQEDTYQQIED